MGSPASEKGRQSDEGPQHQVTIGRAFALGKTEVTVVDFQRFVKATSYRTDAEKNAGGHKGCWAYVRDDKKNTWTWREWASWRKPSKYKANLDKHPVACISWNDTQAYINWLNTSTGKSYRLPSEAEWEYAARAGTRWPRYWGESLAVTCRYANVADDTRDDAGYGWNEKFPCSDGHAFAVTVGRFHPNSFGLYDMLGNVWEWTEDCGSDGYSGAPTDGSARTGNCPVRVLRGGSWSYGPQYVRSATRFRYLADFRVDYLGFRIARSLP